MTVLLSNTLKNYTRGLPTDNEKEWTFHICEYFWVYTVASILFWCTYYLHTKYVLFLWEFFIDCLIQVVTCATILNVDTF